MEATARAKSLGFDDLRARANAHIENTGMKISELARHINYSRSTLSLYLSGKYDSDCSEVERKLHEFFECGAAPQADAANRFEKRTQFFESGDARAIIGVCEACQEYIGLGMVVGRSGFGKTFSLKHYAKLPRVAYIECDDTMSSRDLIRALERELGLPRTNGSIHERANSIKDFCNVNKGYLLIIDEADKLISKNTIKKMEILRAIFDQSDVGMVLSGEPKLEILIKNYDERMANRIDFYSRLGGLTALEVEQFLSAYKIDEDAFAELKARAYGTRNGCFRFLDRTLSNVFRLLEKTPEKQITGKIIEKASAIMLR